MAANVSDSVTATESIKLNLIPLIGVNETVAVADLLPKQKVQVNYVVGATFLNGTITDTHRINRFVLVTFEIVRSWGNEVRRRLKFV